MPFEAIGAADGTARCTDTTCRGWHEPKAFGVRLVVIAKTASVAGGPGRVTSTERVPYELPTACATCGAPVEIDGPYTSTGPGGGRDLTLRWPEPRFVAGFHTIDEHLPGPAADLSLEQRVEQLERAVAS